MIDFSAPHVAFVLWSYALSGVVLGGLLFWVITRNRAIARRLDQLDAESTVRRRKTQAKP